MKRIVTLLLTLVILAGFMATSYAVSFGDVAADAWYNTYVYDLAEKGVINGYVDENGNTYNRTIKKFHYLGKGATSVTDETTVKQSANFVKKGPDGRIYVAYGMYGLQIYELN